MLPVRASLLLAGTTLSLLLIFTLAFLAADSLGLADGAWIRGRLLALGDGPGGRRAVAAAILLLLATDLLLPVPSSVLMTLAGAFHGIVAGALVSFAGAMTSALAGFLLCRRFGRPAFARLAGRAEHARVAAFVERYGAFAILLSRPVPMLTEVTSCVAGLGGMTTRRFTVLAAAGTLPVCLVYAYAGHRSAGDASLLWPVLVALALPALGYAAVLRLHARRAA